MSAGARQVKDGASETASHRIGARGYHSRLQFPCGPRCPCVQRVPRAPPAGLDGVRRTAAGIRFRPARLTGDVRRQHSLSGGAHRTIDRQVPGSGRAPPAPQVPPGSVRARCQAPRPARHAAAPRPFASPASRSHHRGAAFPSISCRRQLCRKSSGTLCEVQPRKERHSRIVIARRAGGTSQRRASA
jgi:hypothetical protein